MLPRLVANIMTWYSRPSPRAQKTSSVNFDRSTGVIGGDAGKNMAPAQGNGAPALIAPVISSAPCGPAAPGFTTVIFASEAPPIMLSVEICQPVPKAAVTRTFVEVTDLAGRRSTWRCVGGRRTAAGSSRTPPFQTLDDGARGGDVGRRITVHEDEIGAERRPRCGRGRRGLNARAGFAVAAAAPER